MGGVVRLSGRTALSRTHVPAGRAGEDADIFSVSISAFHAAPARPTGPWLHADLSAFDGVGSATGNRPDVIGNRWERPGIAGERCIHGSDTQKRWPRQRKTAFGMILSPRKPARFPTQPAVASSKRLAPVSGAGMRARGLPPPSRLGQENLRSENDHISPVGSPRNPPSTILLKKE